MFRIVPEGKQVIIERLGQVNRVAGPGLVFYLPWLERCVKELDVYEVLEQRTVHPPSVAVAVEVRVRTNLDLARCAANQEQLRRLARWPEGERAIKLRDAIHRSVLDAVREHLSAHEAPGSDARALVLLRLNEDPLEREEMRIRIYRRLAPELRKIGYIIHDSDCLWFTVHDDRGIETPLSSVSTPSLAPDSLLTADDVAQVKVVPGREGE